MEQQNENHYDILLAFFTGIVAILPGVILMVLVFVLYFIVIKSTHKILGENIKKAGLIFNSFALLFVLIAFYTCIDWVFWPTINTAIPLLIVSLLFNRNAKRLASTKNFTNFIYVLNGLTILFALNSYLFKF